MKNLVLSPNTAAALTHEAIGHISEADFILACSSLSPFKHLPLSSYKITITDYAHTAFGKPCPIPIHTDDEGITAIDVCIINQGLPGFCMTNLHTAQALSVTPTGNARAASPGGEAMVRMRNTALHPWHDKPADIIASIEDGYYLDECGNCYGDINGDFCCEIKSGYIIKNGKLCQPIRNRMIWGHVADFLKSITMVGNDFKWFTDTCTKWDTIQVGQGAPTIKACLEIGDTV